MKANPKIIPISHVRERPLAIALPVIVASSGMLSGGASVLRKTLERENAAMLSAAIPTSHQDVYSKT